jgi:hypothetical protein
MTPVVNPEALSDLRGYRLPDPVSWWPPAPGWWLLAGLVLTAAIVAVWVILRRQRRRAALRAALLELDTLASQRTVIESAEFARRLSRLLRRYVLMRFPRREVAGLAGDDWLRFLDTHTDDTAFTEGAGRLLREAPYRPASDPAALETLEALARAWIQRNAEAQS